MKVDRAVRNNIAWCEMVCDTHGIEYFWKENLWGLLTEAPPFYPEVITVNRKATMEEYKFFGEKGKVSSVKDSYAHLDLSPYGFKKLFAAEWIYYAPISDTEALETKWSVISTERDLAYWTLQSGLIDVIKPNLLKYENVKIFMQENNEEISGFIANVDAGVVGVSNVFSIGNDNENLWSEIPKIISNEYPGMYMVGYEHGSDLQLAQKSGWGSLGPLRVWIKSV